MSGRMLHLEVTSSAFAGSHGAENLVKCRETAEKFGFTFGVQLHNTVDEETMAALHASKIPLSAHAPIAGDWSLNLATTEVGEVLKGFDDNAAKMRELGISRGVFHGFAMTDAPIPRIRREAEYAILLKRLNRPDLGLETGSKINSDFTNLPEFFERKAILKENLRLLRSRISDIVFHLENDLPVYGYAGMRMRDLIELEHPLCLDFGHLWCSSKLLDFDFYREMEYAMAEGEIGMIHLHNSRMTQATPKLELGDGHQSIAMDFEMDLARATAIVRKRPPKSIVLEIPRATPADVERMGQLWFQ